MYGIPGLRAWHKRGRTVLSRPGIPGRIIIPVTAERWHKAVMVAAELGGDAGGTCSPWLTHPRGWHPAEARWAAAWPGRYGSVRTAGSTATPGSRPRSCGGSGFVPGPLAVLSRPV